MEQLIDAAKDRNMDARIGMMRALRRWEPKAAPAPRRKRARVYRIV
jgi:hypothetical protein